MTTDHAELLRLEVESLKAAGMEQVTPAEFRRRYAAAGFRFERSFDIKQYSRYITGPRAGERSPNLTLYPIHKQLGISAFHKDMPEKDRAALKTLRNSIFAVSRGGWIMEV